MRGGGLSIAAAHANHEETKVEGKRQGPVVFIQGRESTKNRTHKPLKTSKTSLPKMHRGKRTSSS